MKKSLLIIFLIIAGFSGSYADSIPAKTFKSDTNVKKTNQVAPTAPMVTTTGVTPVSQSTMTNTVPCQPASDIHKAVGWILIASMIIFFLVIAVRSNLLRVSIVNPIAFITAAQATAQYKNQHDINKIPKPFSLARSQLGVWTLAIGCSYVYLELCKYVPTQELPFDSTLLALMGISAGTAAISNVIDNNTTLEQQGLQGPSAGFFADILSDQNGINIHRFQNVIWTVIAVVLYLGQIPHLTCGELPVLDNTLIALTGISSATYLGLKVNENKPPALPPTPATEADLPPANPVPPTPVQPIVAPVEPVVVPVQPVVVQTPPVAPPAQPIASPIQPPVTPPPAPPAV